MITLDYGPQGEQQPGDAIVLRYGATGALRRVSTGVEMAWQPSARLDESTDLVHGRTRTRDRAATAPWGQGAPLDAITEGVYGVATPRDARRLVLWGELTRLPAWWLGAPWGTTHNRDTVRRMPWGRYQRRPAIARRAPWGTARSQTTERTAPWGITRAVGADWSMPYVRARPRDHWRRLPWALWSRPLAPGWGIVVEDGEPTTDPDTGQILIPVRRVYLVSNTAHLILQPSGDVLPVLGMSVSIDADSWAWQLRAQLHTSAWDQVNVTGDPVEVDAQINGYTFRFLVESAARSRAFGDRSVTITGRSHAAWLAEPYAPVTARTNDSLMSAQQLINDALDLTGWTLDWQPTDWNVPAGAFSHRGTPLQAATRVAEAAGAIVQADRSAQTLHVVPRYPHPPWEWPNQTADVQIPLDIVTTESIEPVRRPGHNTVYVSGESQGIVGHVTRDGTAGNNPAPMVTDALTTEVAAARQRGIAVLSEAQTYYRQRLQLPVTDEAPLLEIGWLAEFADPAETLLGLVRGISVSAQRSGRNGALVVRQSADLEVH